MLGWDTSGDALTAPAAARNRDAILAVLARVLPSSGTVLEIACGSGEHAVHFARALPGVTWLPSDPEPAARRSVAAHARAAGIANLRPALDLDAAAAGWPPWRAGGISRIDAVVCINMIHIAPWAATEGLMAGTARALSAGGALVLYGPFREGGRHVSDGNAAFDRDLRARDPRWGVRDAEAVTREATSRGLTRVARVAMPANNRCLVYRRTRTPARA